MSCVSEKSVPFAAVSELQEEVNEDQYFAELEVLPPSQESGMVLKIDRVSVIATVFDVFDDENSGFSDDHQTAENAHLKIVSRGRVVIDKTLTPFQLLTLFSNNIESPDADDDEGNYTNVWDLNDQGCAICLSHPSDIFSLKLTTDNSIDARPIAVNGCYVKRYSLSDGLIPFIQFSEDEETDDAATSKLLVKKQGRYNVRIHRVVLPSAENYQDDRADNVEIDIRSCGLTTYKGTLNALDVYVLATKSNLAHGEPRIGVQVWDFSCPLLLRSLCDQLEINLTDPREGEETRQNSLPSVALGCQYCR